MSKIIYASYPLVDQDTAPDWVAKVAGNAVVGRERWVVYDPALGLSGNVEANPSLAGMLTDVSRLSQQAQAGCQQLRLDPRLFDPFASILGRLRAADQTPTLDVTFRNLYILLRSDIVLVDLDFVGHGEPSQEVLYAYLIGVPVVGIAHRFILSPWMADKLNAVVFPRTSDEIVRQVLCHDHKTTAMLDHYRKLEVEKQVQRAAVAEMEDLRAKAEALRNVPTPAQHTEARLESSDGDKSSAGSV